MSEIEDYDILSYEKCTSAYDIAKSRCNDKCIAICLNQTNGRGRWGKMWYSGVGGLWFTIARRTKLGQIGLLNIAGSLATVRGIKEVTGYDINVRWPNDIVDFRKKIGIVNAVLAEDLAYVTIYLNTNNQLPADLKKTAITLKEILNYEIDNLSLLKAILREFESIILDIDEGIITKYIVEYGRLLTYLGESVSFTMSDGSEYVGEVMGLTRKGDVIIRSESGFLTIKAEDVQKVKSVWP